MMTAKQVIQIVLVDDHAVVRAGVRDVLRQASDMVVVGEAETGAEARNLVATLGPDVLIVDLRLPDESGIDVAGWVRASYQQTAVLILSAFDDAPFLAAALQAGVGGYMLKTASPEEIVAGVRGLAEGKPAFDEIMAAKVMDLVTGGRQSAPPAEELTTRELEVIALAAKGHTNRMIGAALDISSRTVQGHLARIYRKLQVTSRTEAVMRALQLGLLPAEGEN